MRGNAGITLPTPTPTPAPTPTPTPAAAFPPHLTLPTANKSIAVVANPDGTPSTGTLTTNDWAAKVDAASALDVFQAADGEYNAYLRGPDSDPGNSYAINPPVAVIIRPTTGGGATIGRMLINGTKDVTFDEFVFADLHNYTPVRIAARQAFWQTQTGHETDYIIVGINQRPIMLYVNSTSIVTLNSCSLLGNIAATTGDQCPDAINGVAGSTIKLRDCLFTTVRNIACKKFDSSGCFHHGFWDRQYVADPGLGSIFDGTLIWEPAGKALNGGGAGDQAHPDNHQFSQLSGNQTGTDTMQYIISSNGSQSPAAGQASIFAQDTNLATGFTAGHLIMQNNLSVNGSNDDCVLRQRGSSSRIRYNTLITNTLPDFVAAERPGPQLVNCTGVQIVRNIVENASISGGSGNVWNPTLNVGCNRGGLPTISTPDGDITCYAASALFNDASFGASMASGYVSFAGIRTEMIRRFRAKLSGASTLGDGTICGAYDPSGIINAGAVYTGNGSFAFSAQQAYIALLEMMGVLNAHTMPARQKRLLVPDWELTEADYLWRRQVLTWAAQVSGFQYLGDFRLGGMRLVA
jgi:hypothetical protein